RALPSRRNPHPHPLSRRAGRGGQSPPARPFLGARMRTPTVSVCLMAYNHAPFVAESIRSVLGQTFADFELIVVDDGSTDDTPRVIASFDDPRIVAIRQPNAGPSAATNRALAA